MRPIEILQLRYFYDSAKYESFAKTAQKYMVPTTAVSSAVKRLEKELDCSLFIRFPNRIVLNDNGRKLQEYLHIVLGELDEIATVFSSGSADVGEVKILIRAMQTEIARYIVEYKKMHPHINFRAISGHSEANYKDYNIIIDEKTDHYSKYEYIELCNAPCYLCVSNEHPLYGRTLTLSQLSNQAFITAGEHDSLHKILVNACKKVGFIPKTVLQSDDSQCRNEYLVANMGICLFRGLPENIKSTNLKILDIKDFDEKQTICIYYNKPATYGNSGLFLNFLKNKIT